MNRNLTAIAIFAAAFAVPTAVHADDAGSTPTVTASVDCQTFTIDISGLPADTPVYAEAGAEQFIVDMRDGHGTLNIGVAEQGSVFFAAVGFPVDGVVLWPFQQSVDCSQTVQVAVPQMDDPAPVKAGLVASVPEAPVEAVAFGNYQMAPPEG